MPTFGAVLRNLFRDESGQDLIEYAMIAALVSLGAVSSIRSLAAKVSAAFGAIGTSFTSSV